MVPPESDVLDVWPEAGVEEDGPAHRPARGLRIVVAGASALDVAPDNLLYYLTDGTPKDSKVLLRRGIRTKPGKFERLVAQWCLEMGHPDALWMLPDPSGERGAVFNRDRAMVASADLVLAFFAPGALMEGGTGHVVECAIDLGVPCYSWTIERDIVRAGEHDPDAIWQGTIESWFGPDSLESWHTEGSG